jgi:AraC family transcriptional regulator
MLASAFRGSMSSLDRGSVEVVSEMAAVGTDDVSVSRLRIGGNVQLHGVSQHSLVLLNGGGAVPVECQIGSLELNHVAGAGNITLIPEATKFSGRFGACSEMIAISIPSTRLAMSAARQSLSFRTLESRLQDIDSTIASAMYRMASPQTSALPEFDRHHFSEEFVEIVTAKYCSSDADRELRGSLSGSVIFEINEFLKQNLESPFKIDDIADFAKQNRSNFPRLFRRATGLSPHQYVMRFRTRSACGLIAEGCSLAEAALATGFVDQSHLSYWMKRTLGMTPGKLRGRVGKHPVMSLRR